MKRRIDYGAKLARNEAATLRWLSKLKLVSNKLGKLTAQRKRIMASMAQQNAAASARSFESKFARRFV